MEDHDYCQEQYVATPLYKENIAPTEQKPKKKSKSNRICCVPECHTTGYDPIDGHGKPSYHRFPQEGDSLRERWLANIKRDQDRLFQIQSHTVVCSLHFEDDVVELSGFSKRRFLKPGAIPTEFECWKNKPHIYKPHKKRPENRLQKYRDELPEPPVANSELLIIDSNVDDSQDLASKPCGEEDQSTNTDIHNEILLEQLSFLQSKINNLERKNTSLDEANKLLKSELQEASFCVENIKPSEFQFYTGFQSRKVFDIVLNLLNPGTNCENIIMVQDKVSTPKSNRAKKLSPENQFLLFLCRLKLGLYEMDLAKRFGVSVATISNCIISWANFCYMRLGTMNIWPTREMVDKTMPSSFKSKYPTTRAIIDCTEIKVEMASSLLLKSQTYSNYKSSNTLKGLIGIAPCGSVTFVSQLYHGSISDREITTRSGFLDQSFDKGDSVMADKGFDIQDLLDQKSVKLNIPPFLGKYGQLTEHEVFQTQSVAAERIHVERAINKIKNFHIFDQAIPVSLFGSINQIWTVCALLTLFQDPILSCPGSE